MKAIYDAIDLCLNRDQSWIEIGRGALARTDYDSAAVLRAEEISARKAFARAVVGDYRGAVDELQVAANAMKSPSERGWIMEQKANYVDFYNAAQAQQALLAASIQNHHVLRPIAGISVERIRAASVQAEGVAAYAADSFSDGLDALLLVRQILESIQWDESRTEEAESNWESLGSLLGFGSERPEKKYNKGPDNLWALTDKQNLLFELKTGAIAQPTKKEFVDQLGGSLRWHDEEYQRYSSSAVPILMAPHPDYDRQGTPPQGTRLIGPEQLSSLKTAVFNVAVALRPRGSWSNIPMIAEHLASNNLTADRFVGAFTRTIGDPVRLS
jgi:hypothetical protein